MEIPFDIKFRPQIESGEYKVFAHEHEEQETRIVCWDNKGEYPIIALVDNEPEKFDKHGRIPGGNRGGEFSLFLVTPEPELSEDERIRKAIGAAICGTTAENVLEANGVRLTDALTYLEKQKEYIEDIRQYAYNKGLVDAEEKQKPLSTEETELNSIAFLEQLGYTCVPPGAKQKPAEWSEEDDTLLKEIVSFFKDGTVKLQRDLDLYAGFLENKFKSLRPQPHWKPSDKQMDILDKVYHYLWADRNATADMQDGLGDFIDDLKNL